MAKCKIVKLFCTLHFAFYILTFIIPNQGFSQGEWNNWYFGSNAAITFNLGNPIAVLGSALFQSAGGTSVTVSDSLGNLLFYSNGWRVWNKNNLLMPNGDGILGGNLCDQPVFSVAKIGDNNQYYLFTVGEPDANPPPIIGLHYSLIDMTLQGGLGDIVAGFKNITVPFGDSAVDQLTGIRHSNNKDVWIVVRKHGVQTKYLAYLVSAAGISPSPVISLSTLATRFYTFGIHIHMARGGDLKISQDGTKFVCSDSLTEICDFNSLTGVVTPKFKIYVSQAVGAEFSVDSKYLYLCMSGAQGDQSGHLDWQFDLSYKDSLNFVQHKILVGDGAGSKLQLAPNWKIYSGANPNIDSLHCINNPSLPGLACNYQKNAVSLAGNENNQCLVQFLQKYKAYIHHNGECQNNIIHFTGDIWPPPDSVHWDFGDPASGADNYSFILNPLHSYALPGTYTVTLFVRHIDNRSDTAWQQVIINPTFIPVLGPDRSVCEGDSVTFDVGACSGCTFQWTDLGTMTIVGTGQTFKTGLAGTYEAAVTNTYGCIGRDTVQLITNPPPNVINNPLSKTICSGESTNIPLTANVSGTTFHWIANLTAGDISGFSADSGIVINQVLVNSISSPGIVTYHITPKVGSCTGTTVDFVVTVNPGDSVKVSISTSTNNICAGTPVTFTATPVNGGIPTYQWKVNGFIVGSNSPNYTYSPINGDIVSCILTSSLTVCVSNNPATSNTIEMIVNPLNPVSVTISPSANPVCSGTTVTFTATPVHEGTTPVYQWKVNGLIVGTNNPIYSYTPVNGDIVTCVLTSNILCPTGNPATSNSITMTVNPNLPVSVSITASANPFCQGSQVTFNADTINAGHTPFYQWKVNGVNVGTDLPTYTYNPASGDLVSCILTSSIACPIGNPATSNSITMIVNANLPAGINITASANPFCPGNSVTFNAATINGGPTPSYQWKVNGVNVATGLPTYTYNPASGDLVSCILTSNLPCVTGNPATSNTIIMSGTLASVVTFTRCNDSITTTNAQPFKLKGGIPLGGTYSGAGVAGGIFHPAIAGVGTHLIIYTYTNAALCAASAVVTILTIVPAVTTCGNPITDIRDGKTYQTVHIGSQCWLAEDLNYGVEINSNTDQRDNCIPEKYHNPASGIGHPASVYQWDELMQYDETISNQGFCLPGWHVPTEADWNTLFAEYINNGFAASPLKYSGFSGFNALLSGTNHMNKTWDWPGFSTFFWSSTSHGTNKAWAHGMNDVDPSVSIYPAFRSNAISVRCVHD